MVNSQKFQRLCGAEIMKAGRRRSVQPQGDPGETRDSTAGATCKGDHHEAKSTTETGEIRHLPKCRT